jgi:autotransporter-associated beta strand protein
MHSAQDVVGGRIQSIAADVANLNSMTPAQRAEAYEQAQTQLMTATNSSNWAQFYTLAKQPYDENDRFADLDALKKQVTTWMTYGFNQIGQSDKVATVPKGAEVLLETRFPYLTDEQRRVVLKSTSIVSGYPVMDDAEGYGRLNLFRAGAGYGTLNGDVNVSMNASFGGFNQYDTWSNDIDGAGKITKYGTGTLALTGENSFSGGVDLKEGSMSAQSEFALGTGDVYIHENSSLIIASKNTVKVTGNLTQLANASLNVALASTSKNSMTIGKLATLKGNLTLTSSSMLPAGTYTVLSAQKIQGSFKNVTLNGKSISVSYQNNRVQLTVL